MRAKLSSAQSSSRQPVASVKALESLYRYHPSEAQLVFLCAVAIFKRLIDFLLLGNNASGTNALIKIF